MSIRNIKHIPVSNKDVAKKKKIVIINNFLQNKLSPYQNWSPCKCNYERNKRPTKTCHGRKTMNMHSRRDNRGKVTMLNRTRYVRKVFLPIVQLSSDTFYNRVVSCVHVPFRFFRTWVPKPLIIQPFYQRVLKRISFQNVFHVNGF